MLDPPLLLVGTDVLKCPSPRLVRYAGLVRHHILLEGHCSRLVLKKGILLRERKVARRGACRWVMSGGRC